MTPENMELQIARLDVLTEAQLLADVVGTLPAMAEAVIERFGSFAEAAAAPPGLLREAGLTPARIVKLKHLERAAVALTRSRVIRKPALSSWSALIDYVTAAMARDPFEQFRIIYLDRKNVVIRDEVLSRGTVDHTPVYPRNIVRRTLEVNASAVIVVHNHPSGDPTPSQADIGMTRQLADALKVMGIVLHDHLVIGRHGTMSFKALGLL
jgi:DNA repair protein RadC